MTVNVCRLPWDQPVLPQAVEYIRQLDQTRHGKRNGVGRGSANTQSSRSSLPRANADGPQLHSKENDPKDNEAKAVSATAGEIVDLSDLLVVLPGTRAANRLKELLAAAMPSFRKSPTSFWIPPEVTTVGALPELLYRPLRPFATASDQQFAWLKALRQLSTEQKRKLVASAPSIEPFNFWHQLAESLTKLSRELAANDLSFEAVYQQCKTRESETEVARWKVLAELQAKYLATLDGLQLWDRQTARLYAIEHGESEIQSTRTIVLVGTVDLSVAMRKMLAFSRGELHSLVFCDPQHTEGFDEFGCVVTEAWREAKIAVGSDQIILAESPEDQAVATAGLWGAAIRSHQMSNVAIGIVDQGLVTTTERHFEEVGRATRWLGGKPVQTTLPLLLLAALRRYLETSRFADLAALVRHPDVKQWLERRGISRDMLIDLDQFQNDSLPLNVNLAPDPSITPAASIEQRMLPFDEPSLAQPQHEDDSATSEVSSEGQLPADLRNHPATNGNDDEGAGQARTAQSASEDSESQALLEGMQPLLRQIRRLLAPLMAGPATWAQLWDVVRGLLSEIYDDISADRSDPTAHASLTGLQSIASAIDELSQVPKPIVARVKPHEGLRLIERLLEGEKFVAPPTSGQVEMLGWLDLPWEDATAAVVSGFNEGCVPSTVQGELFLPDQLRTALGLEDNERRYARDAYSLSLLVHSTPWLRLIVGRRDSEKNPLTPSRLLFAVHSESIGARAKYLFRDSTSLEPIWSAVRENQDRSVEESNSGTPVSREADPAEELEKRDDSEQESESAMLNESPENLRLKRHRFRVPRPDRNVTLANEMSVTRFGDYLNCPYRFYLRHGLRLQSIEDQIDELQGNTFGTLMHTILDRFAKGSLAHSTNPLAIDEQLQELVTREVSRRFPLQAMPAVAIQVEQLRKRLSGFATVQARRTNAGWMIWESEISSLRAALDVDGVPFFVTGRIDRIDQHRGTGEFAVLDYKSSDRAKSPELAHREKGEWINLQLPLYRHLIGELPEVSGEVSVGYFSLPRETKEIRVEMASWSEQELAEADAVAADVVRGIRKHVYWPPREFERRWEEPLDVICQVGTFDRHPDDIGTQQSVVQLVRALSATESDDDSLEQGGVG